MLVVTGPRVILPSPCATPPRSFFLDSGTTYCADSPRSLQALAAPPRTRAASTSCAALGVSHWRVTMAATAVPRLLSLPPTAGRAAWHIEFEGEAIRLGRTGALSARRAAASHSTAGKFVGLAQGLGRALIRTVGNCWNTSVGPPLYRAARRIARTLPLQTVTTCHRGESG